MIRGTMNVTAHIPYLSSESDDYDCHTQPENYMFSITRALATQVLQRQLSLHVWCGEKISEFWFHWKLHLGCMLPTAYI